MGAREVVLRYLPVASLAAVGAISAACGGAREPALAPHPAPSLVPGTSAPSATPPLTLSPSVARPATPSVGDATAAPAPEESGTAALYPRGTRTGAAAVDAFIAAVESSDGAALSALVRYTPVACSGAGYPRPACPPGTVEATAVDTFYNARCDAGWYIQADDIRRYLSGDFVTFAVARLPTPARPIEQGGYPAGDYFVVMENERGPSGEPRAAIISGDGVVALFTGCSWVSARQFLDDHVSVYSASTARGTFVLPPK